MKKNKKHHHHKSEEEESDNSSDSEKQNKNTKGKKKKNTDDDVFNGDIGYIRRINKTNNKEFMVIDYYGKLVTIKREDINTIKHAYAMSIHKSQGSEFNHVILPMSKEYMRMLYNKLLYTGVSRAKKTLVMCGDPGAFMMAVNNNYSKLRKTSLKKMIIKSYE